MSANSNDNGRAYEYAWIRALYDALCNVRATRIIKNSSLLANEKAWLKMESDEQATFAISANSAVDTIIELEPLTESDISEELLLEFQKDKQGERGDVRDILLKRVDIGWEIGLSIKTNNDAVKHSRLSHSLDFAQEWYGIPCSKEYWDSVGPIFTRLFEEKADGTKWSELEDKERNVYAPLLEAFIKEIKRAYLDDQSVPGKLFEYLVGTSDYYKVISVKNRQLTLISTFNLHGTLGISSDSKDSMIELPVVEPPTEIIDIRFKRGSMNTVEMYMNNGWGLNFRIHNASTKVQPSLKLDVRFLGMPPSVQHIECRWNNRQPRHRS